VITEVYVKRGRQGLLDLCEGNRDFVRDVMTRNDVVMFPFVYTTMPSYGLAVVFLDNGGSPPHCVVFEYNDQNLICTERRCNEAGTVIAEFFNIAHAKHHSTSEDNASTILQRQGSIFDITPTYVRREINRTLFPIVNLYFEGGAELCADLIHLMSETPARLVKNIYEPARNGTMRFVTNLEWASSESVMSRFLLALVHELRYKFAPIFLQKSTTKMDMTRDTGESSSWSIAKGHIGPALETLRFCATGRSGELLSTISDNHLIGFMTTLLHNVARTLVEDGTTTKTKLLSLYQMENICRHCARHYVDGHWRDRNIEFPHYSCVNEWEKWASITPLSVFSEAWKLIHDTVGKPISCGQKRYRNVQHYLRKEKTLAMNKILEFTLSREDTVFWDNGMVATLVELFVHRSHADDSKKEIANSLNATEIWFTSAEMLQYEQLEYGRVRTRTLKEGTESVIVLMLQEMHHFVLVIELDEKAIVYFDGQDPLLSSGSTILKPEFVTYVLNVLAAVGLGDVELQRITNSAQLEMK